MGGVEWTIKMEQELPKPPTQYSSTSANDIRQIQTDEVFDVEEGQDEFSCTYIFGNEDHTFGNSLRHVLMQRAETEFCGYSVPHPYDPKLNMRLQVTKEKTANEVLLDGLQDLAAVCDIMSSKFSSAVDDFENAHKKPSTSGVKRSR